MGVRGGVGWLGKGAAGVETSTQYLGTWFREWPEGDGCSTGWTWRLWQKRTG